MKTRLFWNEDDDQYISRKECSDRALIDQLQKHVQFRIDALRYYSPNHVELLRRLVQFGWTCPACKRIAPHCMWQEQEMSTVFTFKFEEHHDHSQFHRFQRTLICSMCNQRERVLMQKFDLSDRFSLSPLELSTVVSHDQPNQKHERITKADLIKVTSIIEDFLLSLHEFKGECLLPYWARSITQ